MDVLHTVADLTAWRERAGSGCVGLVPTMGNLHDGHRALLDAAVAQCDWAVASIFVNPLQFGPQDDLAAYPRTPAADYEVLAEAGMDAVFAPSVEQMYPHGGESATRIRVDGLSDILCGAQRLGHFEGVATVVAKLFHLVRPHYAYFGEKDYQQLIIIRRLVSDLCMDVNVVGVPTVRETDRLALSSRNRYLQPAQRHVAPGLAAALQVCIDRLRAGERNFTTLEHIGMQRLRVAGFTPEYFAVRDADLAAPHERTREFRVLAAAVLGKARLIDNMGLTVSG